MKKPAAKRKRKTAPRRPAAPATTARLRYQLDVQKIELELQNDELRSARAATETALARYTEVFEFAPLGYAVLDETGTVREINYAGSALIGAARSKIAGHRFAAYVATPWVAAFYDLLTRAVDDVGAPAYCDLELATAADNLPVRLTASVLRRTPATYLLAFENIRERKMKEIELERAVNALARANQRKDEFLAMLSHELRNPLAPIRTSIDALRLDPGGPLAAEALAILDRSAGHLTRLVDDLLDVTRITCGKIELARERVDLVAVVTQTVRDHAAEFAARGIGLELRARCEHAYVDGDPARLAQVASNLLANAEKFTLEGGHVRVEIDTAGDTVIVRVRDDGIGIAPELIRDLFEPFVQAPQRLDRAHGGLGLGLAMVRSLVELHGGRASLRSDGPGRGTEAAFVLPCAPPPVQQVMPPVATRAGRRRVLVIEDKRDAAAALEVALKLKGHDVSVAHDGARGLQLASQLHPDVVLCDIGLPDVDGYAVARALRGTGAYLVALTGYAGPDDLERAKAAGFAAHLAKPARLEAIDEVLAAAL